MSTLGNVLWLIFGGGLAGLGYIIGGVLLCLTVVGIPFGKACISLGVATLFPFGKSVVPLSRPETPLRVVLNVLWVLTIGWGIASTHLISAAILAFTVIGLPLAFQHLKLVPIALFPFSHELRATEAS